MIDILKKTLFSTRLMAVLFLVFAAAMAIGTFVESWYSTETARIYIYNATWFEVIMVFFVINFLGNILRRARSADRPRRWRRARRRSSRGPSRRAGGRPRRRGGSARPSRWTRCGSATIGTHRLAPCGQFSGSGMERFDPVRPGEDPECTRGSSVVCYVSR